MKGRVKRAKKILGFYYNHFGLKPPYHLLVCGTFCKQALKDKINIAEQLPKYLCGEVRLFTTRCAIKECELGGSLLYGPMKVLSQYDIIECPHKWFKGATKCLKKIAVKDDSKYIVATQDDELAEKLREHNVPLLHISYNCMNLEDPSSLSKDVAKAQTTEKLTLSSQQEKNISRLRKEMGMKDEEEIKKKRKKISGPNPLSCKKKKKKTVPTVNEGAVDKKRRRKPKKIHLPVHVKEALLTLDKNKGSCSHNVI